MRYIISVAAVVAAVLLLVNSAAVSEAVCGAVAMCLEVMIPSLFAFTVLSVYLQSSGLAETALKPLAKPLSVLLRLPEELCAVFILANIGGYPVGARLLKTLTEQGRLSQRDAGRLLCCCYGSGPSFIVSVVGMRVFGSAAAGAVLYLACFLSSLIIALAVCRSGERIELKPRTASWDLSAQCFIDSVMSAARVMLTVCAMITVFAAVMAIVGLSGSGGGVISALLEISNISLLLPEGAFAMSLCAVLLSFGGVCVVLQVAAIGSGVIPLVPFILSRAPAMAISVVLSLVGLLLPPSDVAVSAQSEVSVQVFSVNMGMSLCVLIMCAMLLCTDKKKNGL